MPKLLDSIPRPLLDDLTRGRWLPVVGAGFSKNAVTPDGLTMPTWRELGRLLADENPAYEASSVLDAISSYEAAFDRSRLVARLADAVLAGRAAPGRAHRAFCQMPFETVITTNFDTLLEQEYAALGRPCHPILEETQLAVPNPYDGPLLIKLHGDIHHPARLIATEDDYDGFLTRNPMMATFTTSLLLTKVAILVGYSLDDPDFRQLLAIVTDRLGRERPRPWAITIEADSSTVSRYERRGVRVINIAAGRRTREEVLCELFDELRDYWVSTVSKVAGPSRPRRSEVATTSDVAVCAVSVPDRLLSFYVDQVFPVLESVGLKPVSPGAVTAPEGSSTAAAEALLAHADAVIVDVGDGTGWHDVSVARERNLNAPIVVVTSESARRPNETDMLTIHRAYDPVDDGDQLARSIAELLTEVAYQVEQRLADEPLRLLAVRAYGPAVVSAFSVLELRLREVLDMPTRSPRRDARKAPVTMSSMLRSLPDIYPALEPLVGELLHGWRVRNEVVHSGYVPSRREAETIVELVNAAILGPN